MGLFGKLFGGKDKGEDKAEEKKASGSARVSVSQKDCAKCGRRMLPGALKCPFCEPQHFGEDIEATMAVDFTPTTDIASLGGVVMALSAAKEHGARAFLHVFQGPNKGATILIGDEPVTIGRKPEYNSFALKDGGASSRHCKISWEGGQLVCTDMGSKNGTFVNQEKVGQPRPLDNSDVVAVNETRLYVGFVE